MPYAEELRTAALAMWDIELLPNHLLSSYQEETIYFGCYLGKSGDD